MHIHETRLLFTMQQNYGVWNGRDVKTIAIATNCAKSQSATVNVELYVVHSACTYTTDTDTIRTSTYCCSAHTQNICIMLFIFNMPATPQKRKMKKCRVRQKCQLTTCWVKKNSVTTGSLLVAGWWIMAFRYASSSFFLCSRLLPQIKHTLQQVNSGTVLACCARSKKLS